MLKEVTAEAKLAKVETKALVEAGKTIAERGLQNWDEFQKALGKTFKSESEAKVGWKVYQDANKSKDIMVIGNKFPTGDTLVAKDWAGHQVLNTKMWSPEINDTWIQGGIDRKAEFYLASPQTTENLWSFERNREKIFQRELRQLKDSGYRQVGDKMLPPK
ncbi:MAG: hypothetical protein ABII74_10035 [Elusimicrobiota bacterium]